MASVLVIGVGSTGLSVLESAQQFYYEFTKSTLGSNIAFMYLETDGNRKPKQLPNGKTNIQSCYLCPKNIRATLENWGANSQYDWMPSNADVLNTHSGAAGQPAYGRVALWEQENNVRQMLTQLYQQIGGNAQTNIYIVGSLTGGTGTGVFLDLAYMVRQCTQNNNIYGMFMLPDRRNVGNNTMDMIYENAYSSLRTLDKYSKIAAGQHTNYTCTLPGGTNISNPSAPFYNAQFFTQDFSDATASLVSVAQLVQSVGFNLVLRVLDVTNQQIPFQSLINARLIDYTSNVSDGIFTTIGVEVFQYPESLLEEYLTTTLLEENMLNRWADTGKYYDTTGTVAPIKGLEPRIKAEARHFVHKTIEDIVSKARGNQFLNKSTFRAALDGEIATIMSGNYQAPSVENYIYSLYDANSQAVNKFYAAISGQSITLRDLLIEAVAKKIEDVSTSYQNLSIIKMWLQEIANALDFVVSDWKKRFKIDGTPSQWNKCWETLLRERFAWKFLYTITGTTKEWYAEALGGVATLCYYSALVPMIQSVSNAMLNRNGQLGMTTTSGISLPSLDEWSTILAKVAKLLNPQNGLSIIARKNYLSGQMSGNGNSQINFLFNGNSYQDDVLAAQGKYQNGGKYLSYNIISNDSLWRFLFNNDVITLKGTMISKAMSFVQGMNLFANTNVVQIMANLFPSHPQYNKVHNLLQGMPANIQGDVPAMVSLVNTEQFVNHNCLKLIVASSLNENDAAGIVQQMAGYKPSTKNDTYVQLSSMKNTVVVYQEYGYLGAVNGTQKTFNPLIHLSYQSQVLKSVQNKINQGIFNASVRLAYIDEKTLVDTTNINIK